MLSNSPAVWIGAVLVFVLALAVKITALVVVARTGAGFVKGDASAAAGTWIREEPDALNLEQQISGEMTDLAGALLTLAVSEVRTFRLVLSPSTVTLFLGDGAALGFSHAPGATQRSQAGRSVRATAYVDEERVRLMTEAECGSSLEEQYDLHVETGRLERRTRVEVPAEDTTVESVSLFRRA
jgi:hypothetical protein